MGGAMAVAPHSRLLVGQHFSFGCFRSSSISIKRQQQQRRFLLMGSDHYQEKAAKYWDHFYKIHHNKFFKDRHYLEKDWGRFFSAEKDQEAKVVLEVGCGAGNTIFPLIAAFPNLYVHACDFSPHAISLVKIFMLSAVSPKKMPLLLQNIRRILNPNGYVLVRDYATGDFAQERLTSRNQMIGENFYVRGDGTCVFCFSEDCLSTLFKREGFNTVEINVYCKQIKNCSRNIVMDRYVQFFLQYFKLLQFFLIIRVFLSFNIFFSSFFSISMSRMYLTLH
ncbi:tRNA N(3)-methylcytidine methyltransferase METTL2-like isoform X3 [Macadamia integrifolia]|uniref:tRNA N(3)-methylcytidine methyltransferase METTL2-like isoform X3 n=1 Tax=Macadamia integrifolia TaxID=60698 RepID=UPI001C4F5E1A|nr:tRNA N(3)-methylcytidine methyltransferase METTL2-like isoform X3 [Macadamia integrifolia]